MASIPNVRNLAILRRRLVLGRSDYEESASPDRSHLRFFTRYSIEEAFARSGFKFEQWHLNRGQYTGCRRLVASIAKFLVPEIDVRQYIVQARKP